MKKRSHRRIYRNIIKIALAALITVILCFASFLTYVTITDFQPSEKETLIIKKNTLPHTVPLGKLSLYTWNIGYCGLGSAMDFFYEGGTMVMPDKSYYSKCRGGVLSKVKAFDNPDFIFIQEVDFRAHRTYEDDQVERFEEAFRGYAAFFAINYKVPFVPVPASSPMGRVESGILTLTHYRPAEAVRYSFPSTYSWPKRLFLLDRCCMLTRYNVSNGKQLVLINTHNSAYDDAAEMRAEELKLLKEIILNEYAKGNYVIAGGDWNQNPVPFNKDSIKDGNLSKVISPGIPGDFLPAGFTWAYDPKFPTNRDVDKPYSKGRTLTTVIDFFVLSPNINLLSANALQTGFEFSDHQPVRVEVELK